MQYISTCLYPKNGLLIGNQELGVVIVGYRFQRLCVEYSSPGGGGLGRRSLESRLGRNMTNRCLGKFMLRVAFCESWPVLSIRIAPTRVWLLILMRSDANDHTRSLWLVGRAGGRAGGWANSFA